MTDVMGEVRRINAELENRVREWTAALRAANAYRVRVEDDLRQATADGSQGASGAAAKRTG